MRQYIFIILSSVFITSGVAAQVDLPLNTLKDRYKNYFTIGVAVSPFALKSEEANLITSQFSGITAENAMKMGPIHPREQQFNWGPADSVVAFAMRNQMRLRGHTLVWHSQTPKWLFEDEEGKQVSKEILLERIHRHIDSVAGRYKGKIYAWDVVNEAISDNGSEFYRPSLLIPGTSFLD